MHVLSSLAGSRFMDAQPTQTVRRAGLTYPQAQGMSLMRLLQTWCRPGRKPLPERVKVGS